MADQTETVNRQATVKLEKKYRRILETGISFLLALPIALQLLIWLQIYNLDTAFWTILGMAGAGAYCMWYGDTRRNKLLQGVNDANNGGTEEKRL